MKGCSLKYGPVKESYGYNFYCCYLQEQRDKAQETCNNDGHAVLRHPTVAAATEFLLVEDASQNIMAYHSQNAYGRNYSV